MPLVIVCGLPSSGKTTRTKELSMYLEKEHNIKSIIVNDESEGFNKNEIFADSKQEKQQRGNLKSATQRSLNKEDVVIVDSLNYIKGFRYELYCVVKSAQTPHCLVFCDISESQAKDFNDARPEVEKYSQEIFQGLVMRFEQPVSQNRWDSPLFLVHPEDKLPFQEIYDALYLRKAPPPNQSTQSPPLAAANFVHELDRITQQIVSVIMDAQKTSVIGDSVTIPGSTDKVQLMKVLSLAELQRCKRQFLSFAKSRAIDSLDAVPNMFVHYLNNTLQ